MNRPSAQPQRKVRCGFTLVELLTVISILALLVALLLPALGKAKFQGEVVACMSRIRQATAGVLMYVNNNSGFFIPLQSAPPPDGYPGYDYGGWRVPALPYLGLQPPPTGVSIYSERYRAIQCTGFVTSSWLGSLGNHYTFSHNFDVRCHWENKSIAANEYAAYRQPHKITELRRPERVFVLIDGGKYADAIHHPHIEEWGLRDHPSVPGHAPGNHAGRGLSIGYTDGRAQFQPVQDPWNPPATSPWKKRPFWGIPKGLGYGNAAPG